jgi:hypothetical protein
MLRTKPRSDARLALALPRPLRGQLIRMATKSRISLSEAARQVLEAGIAAVGEPAPEPVQTAEPGGEA